MYNGSGYLFEANMIFDYIFQKLGMEDMDLDGKNEFIDLILDSMVSTINGGIFEESVAARSNVEYEGTNTGIRLIFQRSIAEIDIDRVIERIRNSLMNVSFKNVTNSDLVEKINDLGYEIGISEGIDLDTIEDIIRENNLIHNRITGMIRFVGGVPKNTKVAVDREKGVMSISVSQAAFHVGGDGTIQYWGDAVGDSDGWVDEMDARNIEVFYSSDDSRLGQGNGTTHIYSFPLSGWISKYARPLEFFLALHLATSAPEFVYRVATDPEFETTVEIGFKPTKIELGLIVAGKQRLDPASKASQPAPDHPPGVNINFTGKERIIRWGELDNYNTIDALYNRAVESAWENAKEQVEKEARDAAADAGYNKAYAQYQAEHWDDRTQSVNTEETFDSWGGPGRAATYAEQYYNRRTSI